MVPAAESVSLLVSGIGVGVLLSLPRLPPLFPVEEKAHLRTCTEALEGFHF